MDYIPWSHVSYNVETMIRHVTFLRILIHSPRCDYAQKHSLYPSIMQVCFRRFNNEILTLKKHP